MATRDEQETTITYHKGSETVHIWTAYPPHIRKFRKDDRVTETGGDGEEWASFTVPTSAYDPVRGLKARRKPLTDEQRRAVASRLEAARNA